jgi:hypothetical protein
MISPIDWRVIPAITAMSDAREPSAASVEKTALWAYVIPAHPRSRALVTMSFCSDRLAVSTSWINGVRVGIGLGLDIRKASLQ